MKMQLTKRKKWAGLALLGAFVLLLWFPIKRMMDVTAVQNAVARDWEITFNTSDRPAMLPAFVDSTVERLLRLVFASRDGGYHGTEDPKTRNRSLVYIERF